MFRKDGKYHVAWHCNAIGRGGYSGSNRNMLNALVGTAVEAHELHDPFGDAQDCEVGIVYGPATGGILEQLPTPYKILFTMFEADKWPAERVAACNCANQVWVPSKFCKETLIASGCDAPIHIVPLGVNGIPSIFAKERTGTFTFGYCGSAVYRKGYDLLLRAFVEEFGPDDDVRLLIHSPNVLSADIPKGANVWFDRTEFNGPMMDDWYSQLDLFVMPTRGEGVGLTPLEAMEMGVCAAVTDWGGCKDYLGDYTLKIAVDGLENCLEFMDCKGRWARPSMMSLKYCMRWAYEHREQVHEMGQKAREVVLKNWTYARTASAMEALIKAVKPKERVNVREVDVVVWHGNPAKVQTAVGGFLRGIPRDLTPDQIKKLNPSDIHAGGFAIERRFRRL